MAKRTVHHVHTTLQLVGLSSAASSTAEWVPNTDIYENESSFVIRMEIAGMKREEIHVDISDRSLVVRGRRPDPCRTGHCHFRQMEINYGLFERRLVIPRSVNGRRVRANYHNGFLMIELPKLSKSDPTPLKVIVEKD